MHGFTLHRLEMLLVVAAFSLLAPAWHAEIALADGSSPEILDTFAGLQGIEAAAIATDGRFAVVAHVLPDYPRSSLTVATPGGTSPPREVKGRVRGLAFSPDGAAIFAVIHRAAKKSDGDASLYSLNPNGGKLRRLRALPATSGGIDIWTDRSALVLTSRDELRTFLLPDLRSGPLFRVPGPNLAVTSVGGTSLMLVLQPGKLLLVDLADPPGEEAMPVREEFILPGPAVAVASAADGEQARVLLTHGTALQLRFDPMRVESSASAVALAMRPAVPRAPVVPTPPEPIVVAAATQTEPATLEPTRPQPTAEPIIPQTVATEPVALQAATPEPAVAMAAATEVTERSASEEPPGSEPPASEPVAANEPPATPQMSAEVDEVAGPQAAAAAVVSEGAEPPPASAPKSEPPEHQLQGTVTGAPPESGLFVVIFGPNNMLREAQRAPIDVEGRFALDDLAPGRYRVQLDAGGSRVLVTDPAFRMIEIEQDRPTDRLTFEVIGQH